MKRVVIGSVFVLCTSISSHAQSAPQQPSQQALLQAAYSAAQRCVEHSILNEAKVRMELQAQIDALKQQLDAMNAAKEKAP